MIKLFSLVLALFLALTTGSTAVPALDEPISPMAASAGTPLIEFVGGDLQAVVQAWADNPPVAASYAFYGVGGGSPSPLYGPEAVNAMLDALSQVRVMDESGLYYTDSDRVYTFIMADGSTVGVRFNHDNLEWKGKTYTVTGDEALRSLRFPAQGRSAWLVDNAPDAALMAFAAVCDDQPPQAVTVVNGKGERRTLTDQARIQNYLEALGMIGLYICTESPSPGSDGRGDTPERSVAFTLASGEEIVIAFSGRNYRYAFPQPVGLRYYWADDTADLLLSLIDGE